MRSGERSKTRCGKNMVTLKQEPGSLKKQQPATAHERPTCSKHLKQVTTHPKGLQQGKQVKESHNQQWLHNQPVRLEPTHLPMFTGSKRNFYRWRKNWKSLQRQGAPSGSAGEKKFQLLNNVDEKICKDLQLSHTTALMTSLECLKTVTVTNICHGNN